MLCLVKGRKFSKMIGLAVVAALLVLARVESGNVVIVSTGLVIMIFAIFSLLFRGACHSVVCSIACSAIQIGISPSEDKKGQFTNIVRLFSGRAGSTFVMALAALPLDSFPLPEPYFSIELLDKKVINAIHLKLPHLTLNLDALRFI